MYFIHLLLHLLNTVVWGFKDSIGWLHVHVQSSLCSAARIRGNTVVNWWHKLYCIHVQYGIIWRTWATPTDNLSCWSLLKRKRSSVDSLLTPSTTKILRRHAAGYMHLLLAIYILLDFKANLTSSVPISKEFWNTSSRQRARFKLPSFVIGWLCAEIGRITFVLGIQWYPFEI